MIIIIGPSASGKTKIASLLIEKYGMKKIITYTSRKKRFNEVDNVSYHFLTEKEFIDKINNNFFFEYIIYNNNYYGTAKEDLKDDKVVILEPSGAKTYIDKMPQEAYVVFLRCSKPILKLRMLERRDNHVDIEARLKNDDIVFKSISNSANLIVDTSASNVYASAKLIYDNYLRFIKSDKI